jgi:hypothetical protein
VGHDLARGTTEFRRTRPELTPTFEVAAGSEQRVDGPRPPLRAVPDLEPQLVAR